MKIIITLEGNLPKKYCVKKHKEAMIKNIQNDLETQRFGEWEVWGELFGNDENVYPFFLSNIIMED